MGNPKFRGSIYQPIDEEEYFQVTRNVIEMSQKAYNEDAFVIHPVDEEEVQDVLFVHTAVAQLLRYSEALRAKDTLKLTRDHFSLICQVLEDMNIFVTLGDQTEHEKTEGIIEKTRTIKERQKIMRELKVIEVLVDMLHYPFDTGHYSFDEIKQQDPVTQVCRHCYILIKNIVSDNRINELYASQWIELFFDHAMRTT
jgi:hypothetical protein